MGAPITAAVVTRRGLGGGTRSWSRPTVPARRFDVSGAGHNAGMGDDEYRRAMAEIRRRSHVMAGSWRASAGGLTDGGVTPVGPNPAAVSCRVPLRGRLRREARRFRQRTATILDEPTGRLARVRRAEMGALHRQHPRAVVVGDDTPPARVDTTLRRPAGLSTPDSTTSPTTILSGHRHPRPPTRSGDHASAPHPVDER